MLNLLKKNLFFIVFINLNTVSLFAHPNEEESIEDTSCVEESTYVDLKDETFYPEEDTEENSKGKEEDKEIENIPVQCTSSSSSSSSSSCSSTSSTTPRTPTKQVVSRGPKQNTPNGSAFWGNLKLTPNARNGGNVIYIITHDQRSYRSQDLESKYLSDWEIIGVVRTLANYLILETDLFDGGIRTNKAVYVGQTVNANLRGGQHSKDLENGTPAQKARAFGQDRLVYQQNLLRHVHPDQLDLFEDIFIIIMGADRGNGGNSRGPKPESITFYNLNLRSTINVIIKRARERAELASAKTESCSDKDSKRKREEDPDQDPDHGRPFKRALPSLDDLGLRVGLFSVLSGH